jgi:DNA-binding transcriptional MerR regulator
MDADELLPIGRFARLSGLSIGALRHYDELDLLRPADVDPATGYRRYRRAQLERARTIARLRELELPLEDVREVLATDDPAEQAARLSAHRARVEARTFRLQRLMHHLDQIRTGKEPIVSTATPTTALDPATHRQLGVDLYNSTWTLLEKADRTPAETDELIHRAHASRWHWGQVGELGGPVNLARGEWLCSRVYALLGRGEPGVWHARRCVEINEAAGNGDWDIASAYEAMARALLVSGDRAGAAEWKAKATAALAGIAEADDREVIEKDLAGIDA